jgi:pimeloyl-ACP methyl ester carboxylesterase
MAATVDDGFHTAMDCLRSTVTRTLPPLGTTLFDRLLLFSPRTWFGIYQVLVESPWNPLDASAFGHALLALILPMIAVTVLQFWFLSGTSIFGENYGGSSSGSSIKTINLLPATLLSPWMIQAVSTNLPLWRHIWTRLQDYRRNRFWTRPTAQLELQHRLQTNRVVRFRRYDIYLPPPLHDDVVVQSTDDQVVDPDTADPNQAPVATNSAFFHQEQLLDSSSSFSSSSATIQSCRALLFLPGALVPHAAYAEVAARLSDAGLVVVVVSAEPTRLVHQHLGADVQSIRRIMTRVQSWLLLNHKERRIRSPPTQRHARGSSSASSGSSSTVLSPPPSQLMSSIIRRPSPLLISEWSLMGHSMGSFSALRLFAQLQHTVPQTIRRVVLWGTGAFLSLATDMTQCTDCHVLLVQGSDDFVVAYGTSSQAEFDALLPATTTYREVISGGTHDGFASYETTKRTTKPTANRTNQRNKTEQKASTTNAITSSSSLENDERQDELVDRARVGQHELACDLTAKFLLSPTPHNPVSKAMDMKRK